MRYFTLLFLLLTILSLSCQKTFGQSGEIFDGTAGSLDGVSKWKTMGGQTHVTAAIGRTGSGKGQPYVAADSAGIMVHAYWDSATGTNGEFAFSGALTGTRIVESPMLAQRR
jgi:hypothetical protein